MPGMTPSSMPKLRLAGVWLAYMVLEPSSSSVARLLVLVGQVGTYPVEPEGEEGTLAHLARDATCRTTSKGPARTGGRCTSLVRRFKARSGGLDETVGWGRTAQETGTRARRRRPTSSEGGGSAVFSSPPLTLVPAFACCVAYVGPLLVRPPMSSPEVPSASPPTAQSALRLAQRFGREDQDGRPPCRSQCRGRRGRRGGPAVWMERWTLPAASSPPLLRPSSVSRPIQPIVPSTTLVGPALPFSPPFFVSSPRSGATLGRVPYYRACGHGTTRRRRLAFRVVASVDRLAAALGANAGGAARRP